MSAYVLVDIDVTDPAEYEVYKTKAAASVAQYGGRYIVRGGNPQTLEGTWQSRRITVLEFSTPEQARAWYASPEYTEARAIRQRASTASMILVEGFAAPLG